MDIATILKAHIPIITLEVSDLMHVDEVLDHYLGKGKSCSVGHVMPTNTVLKMMGTNKYVAIIGTKEQDNWQKIYDSFEERASCLILINPECEHYLFFDAGVLPTPKELIAEHVVDIVEDDNILHTTQALSGLTLFEVRNVLKLTYAEGAITPFGIRKTRRALMVDHKGIEEIDTNLPCYLPDVPLMNWLDKNGKFFLECDDHRLIPRGVLLHGCPGVGKTVGAKMMASKLDIPLYRLDMSGIMVKWVGESEGRLKAVFQQLDMEEPCILLLDEMEKLFTQGDDSGVTGRLLEQLLWWLQEHKSRVLTVMTTNAIDAIPKEVYRPGRINEIFTMKGLDEQGAFKLTNALLATFDENYVNQKVADAVSEIIDDTLNLNKEVSHAQVTEITLDVIKEHYFNKEED